ncbi:MAG TPA: hypothetical protein VN923_06325 [Thermoanaerobaculia bacterium]|nr:hypothetical protein [Thermoanaerobaculia bacterium]
MAAQPTYAPPPPPAPPTSGIPAPVRWIGLGCGALLLLAIVASALFFLFIRKATEGPEQTIQAFLTAAGSGDFDTAHGYFSEDLKKVQPLSEFSSAAAAHQQLFQVRDTTFNSRSVTLKGAELSGTVTLTAGPELPASFKLTKEGGQWRLTSYQLGNG